MPGEALKISAPSDNNAIATVNGLSYTDNIPDPGATYTYCVLPGGSGTCNNVTVGPPPFGFNVVVPSTPDNVRNAGVYERMALDANGDPALAYYVLDPNGNGDDSHDTIYFVSWNRAQYSWNPPVAVAVAGYGQNEGPIMPLSLACDSATGMWALAYHQLYPEADGIMLATSKDGVTWTAQSLTGEPCFNFCYDSPSVAIWNGTFHVAFLADLESTGYNRQVMYVSGSILDPTSKWKSTLVPFPAGYGSMYYVLSLALDSSHTPGIAFNVEDDTQTYEGIAFWRPGQATSTLAGHNDGNTANDNPSLSLTFAGTEARVAIGAEWDYNTNPPGSGPGHVTAMRAANAAGTLWMPAVTVWADNAWEVELPWIAAGSQGQTAIVMASNQETDAWSTMLCGFPKIARSNDFVNFQACAPAPLDHPSFSPGNMTPVVQFGFNDKLWVAFNNNDDSGDIGIGLVLWREQ